MFPTDLPKVTRHPCLRRQRTLQVLIDSRFNHPRSRSPRALARRKEARTGQAFTCHGLDLYDRIPTSLSLVLVTVRFLFCLY